MKRRKFFLIPSILVVLLSATTVQAQFGPARVIVVEVAQAQVAPMRTFVATVSPLRKSVVGTAVAGRVEKFLFDENNPETKKTFVRRGAPLANLREGTIRIKVDAAKALLDLRQAEYNEEVETFDGRKAQADAKLKATEVTFAFAMNQYERNRQLYESNRSISRENYEESRAARFKAEEAYIDAKIELGYLIRKDRIIQAKARLDEADANWRELNDRVDKYTIRAPFDGFVVAEHTEVGAWIQEGDPVAEIVQLQPIEVRAFVPEKHIGRLQLGGVAIIRPNVSFKNDVVIPPGRITGVVAEAVSRSRTFPVKIQVENPKFAGDDDNPQYALKAGMLAEVELQVGAKELATLVPKDALVLNGPDTQIYLAVPDPKNPEKYTARSVRVTTGTSLGKWIAVTAIGDELQPGDLVVEKGNERLRSDAPLLVERTGASRPPTSGS